MSSWTDDIAYAMTLNKILSWPIGGWPLQKYNIFALMRHVVFTIGLVFTQILLYLEIYYDCNDPYITLDVLLIASCGFLALLKMNWFRLYSNNLTTTFSSAVDDYLAIDTEEKRVVMRRHAYMGRIIFYSIAAFSYVASVGYISLPVILSYKAAQVNGSHHGLPYPIPSTCTIALFHLPTALYLLIFVMQCIMLWVICSGNLGHDSLFLTIALHVCGQVELLRIEFAKLSAKNTNVHQDFIKLTIRHIYLLNQAMLLANVISFVLLIQLFVSCVLICTMGFQLIVALQVANVVMIIKAGFCVTDLLLQLFVYSCVGDYLKFQIEEVAFSVYSTDWYNLSVKLVRNIMFIIARSQQPVQFAGGKFFVANIESFMTILKTSLSYLSVLRVMINT